MTQVAVGEYQYRGSIDSFAELLEARAQPWRRSKYLDEGPSGWTPGVDRGTPQLYRDGDSWELAYIEFGGHNIFQPILRITTRPHGTLLNLTIYSRRRSPVVGVLIPFVIVVGLLGLGRTPWLSSLVIATWVIGAGSLIGYLMGRGQERRLIRWFDDAIQPHAPPSAPTPNRPDS